MVPHLCILPYQSASFANQSYSFNFLRRQLRKLALFLNNSYHHCSGPDSTSDRFDRSFAVVRPDGQEGELPDVAHDASGCCFRSWVPVNVSLSIPYYARAVTVNAISSSRRSGTIVHCLHLVRIGSHLRCCTRCRNQQLCNKRRLRISCIYHVASNDDCPMNVAADAFERGFRTAGYAPHV